MGVVDDHISLGTIFEIGLTLVGLGGGWATLKITQKDTQQRLAELKDNLDEDRGVNGQRHDTNVERMNKLELKIADECLKKSDFRDFERRFDVKIEKLEHAMGNTVTKAAGLVADLLRTQGRPRDER